MEISLCEKSDGCTAHIAVTMRSTVHERNHARGRTDSVFYSSFELSGAANARSVIIDRCFFQLLATRDSFAIPDLSRMASAIENTSVLRDRIFDGKRGRE